MNRVEFNDAMEGIHAFYAPARTQADVAQLEKYMTALHTTVSHIQAADFAEVARRLKTRLNPMKRPMPGDFLGIYRELKGEVAATASGNCRSCDSTGFVYVWLYHGETGRSDRFARPCADCQPRHPLRHAGVPKGWVETESTPHQEPDFASMKINQGHAEMLLSIADKCNFNLKPEVKECLIRNACGEAPEANAAPAKVNAVARKNELLGPLRKAK